LEKLIDLVATPAFGLTVAGLIALALILHHFRQLALIRTGLIKKPSARIWRIDYEKLRSGFWMAALGGVIAAAMYYKINFWLAFWLLVALLGVGQILASLLGRERWSKHRIRFR
jgi:hypothetical protein